MSASDIRFGWPPISNGGGLIYGFMVRYGSRRRPRLSRRVDPEHRATGRSPLVARPCSSARRCQTCAISSRLTRALGGIICASLQRSCARRRCCSALIDGRIHLRQHIGTRSELRFSCHPSHVPFHLEASEPFHVAREQFRTDGRPIPQWSRLKAGYSDDLGNRQARTSQPRPCRDRAITPSAGTPNAGN